MSNVTAWDEMSLPQGWTLSSIKNHLIFYRGGAPLTPDDFVAEGIAILPKKAVDWSGVANIPQKEQAFASTLFATKYSRSCIHDENCLATTLRDLVPTGPTLGLIVRIPTNERYILAQGVYGFQLKDSLYSQLLVYLSQMPQFREQMRAMMVGSTQVHVRTTEFFRTSIPVPPLPQQKKIARILTTVDSLIEKTEALIEKYKSIKQGMMHDLFTRGVDQNGKLRPPYEESPHLYKESPLGWIPRDWDVAVLGEEIGPITSGWSPTCDAETAAEGEWAILKTTAVVWDGYDDGENKRLPYHLLPLPKLEVVTDDILITRKGPVERVGVVVHVPETRPHMMIPDTVFRIRIEKDSELSSAFVPLALGCEQVQTDWFGRKIGLADAQVNVNHGILRSTVFPKPNRDEQLEICKRLESIQSTLDAEQLYVETLMSLKSGLMQDLLTGKVRVNVDEAEGMFANG